MNTRTCRVHIGGYGEVPWCAVFHRLHGALEETTLLRVVLEDGVLPLYGLIQEPEIAFPSSNQSYAYILDS